RTVSRASDQAQSLLFRGDAFLLADTGEVRSQGRLFDTLQVEAHAARQDRDGDLADFGGGKDENDVRRRLLQRLQQGVEGRGGEHVHFVDDVNLVAGLRGPVADAIDQFAYIVDASSAGRVHLEHVGQAIFGNRLTNGTVVSRAGGRPCRAVGTGIVYGLGENPCR